MPLADLWPIFLFNLIVGLTFGTILYRGDFCMAGILRDQFLFRDRTLLRPLLLAIILTLFLFTLARYSGLLSHVPPPTLGGGSLLGVLGGCLFGLGMVLAGGCVISTLYKMAAGNLSHGIAFLGIVAGSLLYAELYPFIERVEQALLLTRRATLLQLWPLGGELLSWLLIGFFAVVFMLWLRHGRWRVRAEARGYLQPWKIAVALALLNLAAYLVNGWPIGISTAYSKLGAMAETWLAPAHAERVVYFSRSPLTATVEGVTLRGGGGPQFDLYSFTELPLMIGVVAGAFLNAVYLREFRVYGLPPLRQGTAAFGGGVLVALGARMANGCNIKLLLGGLPLLSVEAILFATGMVAGAWCGARLLPHIILRRVQ